GGLLEVRGELEEDRPELVAERGRRVGEVAERLVDVTKPGEVRDLLRSLQDVREAGGSGRRPRRERLGVRHPIERRVDLDGGEALDVIREHLRGRQLVGMGRAAPLRTVVAGGPYADVQARLAAR